MLLLLLLSPTRLRFLSLLVNLIIVFVVDLILALKDTYRGYKDIQDKSLSEFAARERWL
jgi:hypothetical protein